MGPILDMADSAKFKAQGMFDRVFQKIRSRPTITGALRGVSGGGMGGMGGKIFRR